MKGLADTAARLAGVVGARQLVAPPAPAYRPNRATRRRGAKRAAEAAVARQNRVQISGRQLAQAQRNGWRAGNRGQDHTVPGTCPYVDPRLVDAWAAGYVVGKRERQEAQPDTEETTT